MTIEEMQTAGVFDYYDILIKWIQRIIDEKYPITIEDFRAIIRSTTTENLTKRKKAMDILKAGLNEQLAEQKGKNAKMIEQFEKKEYILTIQLIAFERMLKE